MIPSVLINRATDTVNASSPLAATFAVRVSPRGLLTAFLTLYVLFAFSVGALPLVWWAGCVIEACRAGIQLGVWPSYGHPDPKDFPSSCEATILACVLPYLAAAGAIHVIRRFPLQLWFLVSSVIWLVLWGITSTIFFIDPGGVINWMLD